MDQAVSTRTTLRYLPPHHTATFASWATGSQQSAPTQTRPSGHTSS